MSVDLNVSNVHLNRIVIDCFINFSRIVTGGADKTAVVFDKESEQVICTLKGHTKKVTDVIYHPNEVSDQIEPAPLD